MDGSYFFAHAEHSNSKMLVFLFMGENSITALLRTYVWGRQSHTSTFLESTSSPNGTRQARSAQRSRYLRPVGDSESILVLLAALHGCMMHTSFPSVSASGTVFLRGIQKGETP
jgi:hypothetical protein